MKLDFGLTDSMLSDSKWDYQFSLIYSVTLSSEDLETSIVVRNTGSKNYDFKLLFHSYFTVDVSSLTLFLHECPRRRGLIEIINEYRTSRT